MILFQYLVFLAFDFTLIREILYILGLSPKSVTLLFYLVLNKTRISFDAFPYGHVSELCL